MLSFLPEAAMNREDFQKPLTSMATAYRHVADEHDPRSAQRSPWVELRTMPRARFWAEARPVGDSVMSCEAWLSLRAHCDVPNLGILAKLAELLGCGSSRWGYHFHFLEPESWWIFDLLWCEELLVPFTEVEVKALRRLRARVDSVFSQSSPYPPGLRKSLKESVCLLWPHIDDKWGAQWVFSLPFGGRQADRAKKLGCIWSKEVGGWVIKAGANVAEVIEKLLKLANKRTIILLPSVEGSTEPPLVPNMAEGKVSDRLDLVMWHAEKLDLASVDPVNVRARGEIAFEEGAPMAYLAVPYVMRSMRARIKTIPGASLCSKTKKWRLPVTRYTVGDIAQLPSVEWECDFDQTVGPVEELPGLGLIMSLGNGVLVLDAPYCEKLVRFVRLHIQSLDKGWDAEAKVWKLYLAEARLPEALSGAARRFSLDYMDEKGRIYKGDAVAEQMEVLSAEVVTRVKDSYKADGEFEVDGLLLKPMPFQKAGIRHIVRHGSTLIADDCGLGKTLQAIGALLYTESFPVVVVCPAIARLNWRAEFAKSTNIIKRDEIFVVGIDEKEEAKVADCVSQAKVSIISYDGLQRYVETLLSSGSFMAGVMDESHYIKNPSSIRGQLAPLLFRMPTMQLKLLLSATPYYNRPSELINQLKVIDKLEIMGGEKYLTSLDAVPDHRKQSCYDQFNRRCRGTFMVRRQKDQVLDDCPRVIVSDVPAEKTGNYVLAEQRQLNSLVVSVAKGLDVEDRKVLIEKAQEDPAGLVDELVREHLQKAVSQRATAQFGEVMKLRHDLGVEKLPSILAWIKSSFFGAVDRTQKLVVFAHHIEVQKRIYEFVSQKLRIETVWLSGGLKPETRQEYVDSFQEGSVRCCVASMQAAKTAITLTAASHVLFAELDYSPEAMIQARDRLIRVTQRAPMVNVYFAFMEDSLDNNMRSSVHSKMDMITQGMGDTKEQAALDRKFSLEAMSEIFARHPAKVAELFTAACEKLAEEACVGDSED
jgi:SWI/SNF-related matrix-associated actin-dependent regulator 1 of chromatin subfamily A